MLRHNCQQFHTHRILTCLEHSQSPIFPMAAPSRNLPVAKGKDFFFWCGSKWNIFSTKCKITCVVSWLMFSVSEWKDQAAVRSSSPEVWRPGLIQALKIWIESVSAAFNCSSDNYRLSQETSTPVPDSITQSHASPKITIAVNKVKLILLSLCYSKEKGEADFTTQHPIESKPQGELLVELELGISFFSQDVVMDALNFKTNKQNHILCLLSLL